jgi:transcriptional regulator with XRE-family HTH domain
MATYQQQIRVRTRKLGLLIYDARISRSRKIEPCAKAMGLSVDAYQLIEAGETAPTLPQLESLAFFLDVPLEHFWGNQTISTLTPADPVEQPAQLKELRQRIIGTRLRMARSTHNLSVSELALKTNIPVEKIQRYEMGLEAIPIPDLELLASTLEIRNDDLFDQRGIIGKWRSDKAAVQNIMELPPGVRAFISKPVNLPYLELAMRLSDLSAEKLRSVAEGLLEITY